MPYFQLILPQIIKHFQQTSSKDRLRLFAAKDRQVEGWFKGELMLVFEASAQVTAWEPEVTYDHGNGRAKYDFVLKPAKRRKSVIGVEIKTACPGWQHKRTLAKMAECRSDFDRKGPFPLTHIISGLVGDAERLRETNLLKERICLVFVYGEAEWVWRYGGEVLPPGEFLHTFRNNLQENMPNGWTIIPTMGEDPAPIGLGGERLLHILSYQVRQV